MCIILTCEEEGKEPQVICWFYDKESAEVIKNKLEMENFDVDYELVSYSTLDAIKEKIPYCREVFFK